jgi:tetratricopeptide (TPR) repeat protein
MSLPGPTSIESLERELTALNDRSAPDAAVRGRVTALLAKLAVLYERAGRKSDALRACRQALELQEQLAAQHPESVVHTDVLAALHYNVGQLQRKMGRPKSALSCLRRAANLWRILVAVRPERTEYRERMERGLRQIERLEADSARIAAGGPRGLSSQLAGIRGDSAKPASAPSLHNASADSSNIIPPGDTAPGLTEDRLAEIVKSCDELERMLDEVRRAAE